ncbi:MAG: ribosome small subunit-dependent GTPase A [Prevotella sp.]|nr:ribosome small subunit-dependent GTPase A [Prevotella sp.]
MFGLVIKNTGSWYTVLFDDGTTADCKIKGNFRLRGIRSTNPVAVGDHVEVADGFITEIHDRKNYIIRKSPNLSKQSHIIAANVDQAVLVITVNYPQTSTTFIDRFLASAEAYRVPVILLFNKTDLLDADERHYQELMVNLYETIGYQCLQVSAQTGEGIDRLLPLLEGKVTVFSGNSGVGKSTLLNTLVPGINLRTAEISDAHNTGMHTTTFSEMIPLHITRKEEGGRISRGRRKDEGGRRLLLRYRILRILFRSHIHRTFLLPPSSFLLPRNRHLRQQILKNGLG